MKAKQKAEPKSSGAIISEQASAYHAEVIEAPLWLKQRLEALRKMPQPTLERVRAQMKASPELLEK